MKKILAMGIALLSFVLFSACGNEDGPSGHAAGTYMVLRTISMRVPPTFPFIPVSHETKLTIKAENENFVNIILPGASYTLEGEQMDMPTFTLRSIPVLDDGKGGITIPHHDFNQKVGNKTVIGTIEGDVEADGDLELDVEFKYGAMPFYMIQKYESLNR